jgi:hypothetical protein
MSDGRRKRRQAGSSSKQAWYALHRARRFRQRFGLDSRPGTEKDMLLGERHDHVVALLQFLHTAADLDNLAQRVVAEHVGLPHRLHEAHRKRAGRYRKSRSM